jgi:hypothetical protein
MVASPKTRVSRRVIALWLASKLLTTKDAIRFALDGLGQGWQRIEINWDKGFYDFQSLSEQRSRVRMRSFPQFLGTILYFSYTHIPGSRSCIRKPELSARHVEERVGFAPLNFQGCD